MKLPGDANLLESSKRDILGSPWGGSHNSPQPKRIFRKESHMLPPGGVWKEGAYQLGIKLQVAMLRICLHRFYIYIYIDKHILSFYDNTNGYSTHFRNSGISIPQIMELFFGLQKFDALDKKTLHHAQRMSTKKLPENISKGSSMRLL